MLSSVQMREEAPVGVGQAITFSAKFVQRSGQKDGFS